MKGYYEEDPNTRIDKGQTVAEVLTAAQNLKAPTKQARRPMGEDRKTFLRMMGLGKWIK